MRLARYPLKAEPNLTVFEFVSYGPKGPIRKLIKFQATNEPDLYNLAFGDANLLTGEIDDLAVSNNGDSEQVLAAVVSAVYAFFEAHPEAYVFATGSTSARTRLYRTGLSRFYEELRQDFYLYGQVDNSFYPFEIDQEYVAFLAQRKL